MGNSLTVLKCEICGNWINVLYFAGHIAMHGREIEREKKRVIASSSYLSSSLPSSPLSFSEKSEKVEEKEMEMEIKIEEVKTKGF